MNTIKPLQQRIADLVRESGQSIAAIEVLESACFLLSFALAQVPANEREGVVAAFIGRVAERTDAADRFVKERTASKIEVVN